MSPLKLICHGDLPDWKAATTITPRIRFVTKQMRVELVANAIRSLAPQMVHLQDDLEAPQMQLRLPSSPVQRGNLLGRIFFGIQQCCHHHQRLGCESLSETR